METPTRLRDYLSEAEEIALGKIGPFGLSYIPEPDHLKAQYDLIQYLKTEIKSLRRVIENRDHKNFESSFFA